MRPPRPARQPPGAAPDGVLLAAEEPLGAVDRVERPEPVAIPACPAAVDPSTDFVGVEVVALLGPHMADVPEHLVEDRGVSGLADFGRVFLGDDRIVGERLARCGRSGPGRQSATVTGLLSSFASTSGEISVRTHGTTSPPRAPHVLPYLVRVLVFASSADSRAPCPRSIAIRSISVSPPGLRIHPGGLPARFAHRSTPMSLMTDVPARGMPADPRERVGLGCFTIGLPHIGSHHKFTPRTPLRKG